MTDTVSAVALQTNSSLVAVSQVASLTQLNEAPGKLWLFHTFAQVASKISNFTDTPAKSHNSEISERPSILSSCEENCELELCAVDARLLKTKSAFQAATYCILRIQPEDATRMDGIPRRGISGNDFREWIDALKVLFEQPWPSAVQ